jgi:hypothetical protein
MTTLSLLYLKLVIYWYFLQTTIISRVSHHDKTKYTFLLECTPGTPYLPLFLEDACITFVIPCGYMFNHLPPAKLLTVKVLIYWAQMETTL